MTISENPMINTLITAVDKTQPFNMPFSATLGSAGYDLAASQSVSIPPMDRIVIPTNLSLSLPFGYVGLVCPRSGLALKKGLTVLNAPGVIDCDYTGEIKVMLVNLSLEMQNIKEGDRIAQLLIMEYSRVSFSMVKDLPTTVRGDQGFGSTDLSH